VLEVAQANIFLKSDPSGVYTDLTWAEDTATQGCDRSADSAAGMARGGGSRPASRTAILARSDKSQGFGDRVPNSGFSDYRQLLRQQKAQAGSGC